MTMQKPGDWTDMVTICRMDRFQIGCHRPLSRTHSTVWGDMSRRHDWATRSSRSDASIQFPC
jgi:hypothetical protein